MKRGWPNVLKIVAALLIVATLLPLIVSNQWWIRIFDYPRAQIAVGIALAMVAVALAIGWRSRTGMIWIASLGIALAYQVARILPYVPGYPVEAIEVASCPGGNRLSVVVANVLQSNRNAAGLLDRIADADPDLVLLLETDSWWARAVAPLAARYPHRIGEPIANTYGLLLLSRLPLDNAEIRHLIEDDVPSVRAEVRLAGGSTVDFHGLHPRPPVPGIDTAQRDAELVLVGREIARKRRPALVAGDMNDVAWSDTSRLFQKAGGLLDPRVGRGLYPTFPAGIPLVRWPLDHVFFTDDLALVDFGRLPGFGSDHLPIAATLCYAPRAAPLQDEPTADAADRRKARETVVEGKAEEREER